MTRARRGKPTGVGRRDRLSVETLETRTLLAGHTTFAAPAGGWAYFFDGDGAADGAEYTSLDGTWDHDNGSDEWDGSEIGAGNPGGVNALTDGDTTFIRVQDTGDPRDTLGISDPGSNRKQYFTHLLSTDFSDDARPDNLDTIVDDGVTLYFRARVATPGTGPLDPQHPDEGSEENPWPEEGIGYYQHNGGKSMIAVKQVDGPNVAFGLARGSNVNSELFTDLEGNSQDGLILPHLLQENELSDDSDPGNSPGAISTEFGNVLPVEDLTQWQEFWITIEAGTTEVDGFEDGTHVVNVYYAGAQDPLEANRFGITAATGSDGDESYIGIGAGATGRGGAFDVDFFAWAPGVQVPILGGGSDLPDITAPGDELVRVDGENDGDSNDGAPPASETVEHVIDDVTQKHLNFLDLGSGFIVTPSAGSSVVTGLRLYTANDAVERDPASYVLEGGLGDGTFTLISEDDLSLPDRRNEGGDIPIDRSLAHQEILFENTQAYTSYRLTFPTLKDTEAANSMQIAEVEFLGEIVASPDLPGDIDGDGSVAFSDFLILSANFGQMVEPGTLGDIDGDGNVAFGDFLVLSANFGQTAAAVDAVFSGGAS